MGRDTSTDKLLLRGGRIPGAVKMATIWLIPKERRKACGYEDKTRKGIKT